MTPARLDSYLGVGHRLGLGLGLGRGSTRTWVLVIVVSVASVVCVVFEVSSAVSRAGSRAVSSAQQPTQT